MAENKTPPPESPLVGRKFINVSDGETYSVVSEVEGIVSYESEDLTSRHPTRYLGRAEFDKRFQPVVDTHERHSTHHVHRGPESLPCYCAASSDHSIGQEIRRAPGVPRSNLDGNRQLPYDRETLGRFVREAWVRWAETQPNPKPSWLIPYDELSEPDKEADRQIGEALARWTLIGDAARASLSPPPSTREGTP